MPVATRQARRRDAAASQIRGTQACPSLLQAAVRAVAADEMDWERMPREQRRNGHRDQHMKGLMQRMSQEAASSPLSPVTSSKDSQGRDKESGEETSNSEDHKEDSLAEDKPDGARHNFVDILQAPACPGNKRAEIEAEAADEATTARSSPSVLCDGTGACRDPRHSSNSPPPSSPAVRSVPTAAGSSSLGQQRADSSPEHEQDSSEEGSTIVVGERPERRPSPRPRRTRKPSIHGQQSLASVKDTRAAVKPGRGKMVASKGANDSRPAMEPGQKQQPASPETRAEELRSGRSRRPSQRAQESAELARPLWLAARRGKEKRLPRVAEK